MKYFNESIDKPSNIFNKCTDSFTYGLERVFVLNYSDPLKVIKILTGK